MISSTDHEPLEEWELMTEVLLALVTKPEHVRIEERKEEDASYFSIHVAPEDLGLVIGKNGETISLVRRLFGRIAALRGHKIYVHLQEPNRQHAAGSVRRIVAA